MDKHYETIDSICENGYDFADYAKKVIKIQQKIFKLKIKGEKEYD